MSGEDRVKRVAFARNNKGFFGFCMCNKILCRLEKIKTRSKKNDLTELNTPVYLIQ